VESAYPPTVKLVLGPYAVANVYGNKHKALRKMLGSAFNLRIIHQGLGTMVSLAETTLSEWASRTSSSAFDEGRRYALRVLIHAMVGNDENWTSHEAFNERNETFEVWRKGLFCAPIPIPGTTFWRAMVARQQLLRTIRKSLDRHDSAKDVHKEGVLQSLLNAEDEHAGKLPRRALEDIFLNFVFAGQDTSAATLCQLLRFLAAHPKAMQALRDEQHIVRQKHGEEISVAALNDMKLAEATIKETLRLAPVVPQAPRIALRQFMLAGHKIYPGTLLQAGIAHATMTDPQWKDDSPHLFMPERWLNSVERNKTENATNRTEIRRATKEAGWLAFGGGARICPGKRLAMAELTIFTAVLARSYNFEILDHQEGWEQFPLMRPRNGMAIRISALSV
jgi:cytochrome P450